jgi:hypothetical protein
MRVWFGDVGVNTPSARRSSLSVMLVVEGALRRVGWVCLSRLGKGSKSYGKIDGSAKWLTDTREAGKEPWIDDRI